MLPDSNCLGVLFLTILFTLIFLGKHNDSAYSPSNNLAQPSAENTSFIHLVDKNNLAFLLTVLFFRYLNRHILFIKTLKCKLIYE